MYFFYMLALVSFVAPSAWCRGQGDSLVCSEYARCIPAYFTHPVAEIMSEDVEPMSADDREVLEEGDKEHVPVTIYKLKEGELEDWQALIRQFLPYGRQLMKDLVTVHNVPSLNNIFTVTRQLKIGAVIDGIGAVAGIISDILEPFLPNEEHEQIMNEFARLHNSIANVRDDIRQLEREIDWRSTVVQYSHVTAVIKTAMDLSSRIPGSRDAAERRRRQERFAEHCRNQGLQMALDQLFNGVLGRGAFQTDILESYYKRSEGHRPNMIKLALRMVHLLVGGLNSLMAYEGIVRGPGGVRDIVEDYKQRMADAQVQVEEAINMCTSNFKTNMQKDLERIMRNNAGRPNRDHLLTLQNFMTQKYDWFYLVSEIYNDLGGFNNHIFNGFRVEKLHFPDHNKKCGIVFYKPKSQGFRQLNRRAEAHNILRSSTSGNAQQSYNKITADLRARGIGWWGHSVIKRFVDLWQSNNCPQATIWEVGPRMTKMLLLN